MLSRLVGCWHGTLLHRAGAEQPFQQFAGTSDNRWVPEYGRTGRCEACVTARVSAICHCLGKAASSASALSAAASIALGDVVKLFAIIEKTSVSPPAVSI